MSDEITQVKTLAEAIEFTVKKRESIPKMPLSPEAVTFLKCVKDLTGYDVNTPCTPLTVITIIERVLSKHGLIATPATLDTCNPWVEQ